jgi:hypothetical protein
MLPRGRRRYRLHNGMSGNDRQRRYPDRLLLIATLRPTAHNRPAKDGGAPWISHSRTNSGKSGKA